MKYLILLIASSLLFIQKVDSQNIWPGAGNVGIGTENPSCWFSTNYVLEIAGVRPVLKLNSSTNISTVYFTCSDVNPVTHIGEFHLNHFFNKDDNSKSRLIFGTYPAGHAMNVLANGNVGIGTIEPQNLLDVNGTIRAKEIKVETGWADFVFHPSYKLKPLNEVETYIKNNNHLEGIPTAAEVEKNGANLGEMQVKLLQKVEELTLYSIDLEKSNIELKQKVDEQGKELAELKKLVIEKLK